MGKGLCGSEMAGGGRTRGAALRRSRGRRQRIVGNQVPRRNRVPLQAHKQHSPVKKLKGRLYEACPPPRLLRWCSRGARR
jgi:hypothetical protein